MSQLVSSHKFSYSQLSTYKVCPQQYKIIYLDGIRKYDESIEAFMGKRVHEVLDWLYSADNLNRPYFTFDSLCQQYDSKWIEKWHENIYIVDRKNETDFYYNIGKRCLSNYYSKYGPSFNQSVEATELKLEFKVGNYLFKGIIDRLDQIDTGEWTVHDYKTSKYQKSKLQASNDIQLALYKIAVEQNFSNIKNIYLTWHFLRMGNEVTIQQTNQKLEILQKKIINLVEKIISSINKKNGMLPKESILCNWCYLWQECSAKVGRNPVRKAK